MAAHAWARARSVALRVLGGGSNLRHRGLRLGARPRRWPRVGSKSGVERRVELTPAPASPGTSWCARRRARLAGLECLSGIPGLVGATPIQNVGAYGQEVARPSRRCAPRGARRRSRADGRRCGFAYDSRSRATIRAATSCSRALHASPWRRSRRPVPDSGGTSKRGALVATSADVRESVLALRRTKSMVIDAGRSQPPRSARSS